MRPLISIGLQADIFERKTALEFKCASLENGWDMKCPEYCRIPLRIRRFLPAPDPSRVDIEEIQAPPNRVINHFIDAGWLGIERRNGWHDDRANFRDRGHVAAVGEVKRRLAQHEDQAPAFFQRHVGSAGDQCSAGARSNFAQRLGGTRRDDHAARTERAARNRRGDIVIGVNMVGEQMNVFQLEVAFVGKRHHGRPRHDEMCLEIEFAKRLEQTDTVWMPRRAGYCDDKPLSFHGGFLTR